MNTPWKSVAKVQVDGVHSGTGFLVTKDYVLTALHVVADGEGRPHPRILLQFNTNTELGDGPGMFETGAHLEPELWSVEHDFALLKCDKEPPAEPLMLTDKCNQLEECSSPGFGIQSQSGFTAIGRIASPNDPLQRGGTAISIQFDFGSGVLVKGHSGAPVLVRNKVVGMLRSAFLDEAKKTMGGIVAATSMQQVVRSCSERRPRLLTFEALVRWPTPSVEKRPILADRKEEFQIFKQMITGQSKQRVLLLAGETGAGKTVLVNGLVEYARSIGVAVAHIDCKGARPLDSVFGSLLMDVPGLLPQAETAMGFLRFSLLIGELKTLDQPLVIALDTWQDSTDETRKWIEHRILPYFLEMPAIVVVIAGKEVPNHKLTGWENLAELRHLKPIPSVDDWYEYTQRKWPSANIAKLRVETITLSYSSETLPNQIDLLLHTLQSRLPTSPNTGGSE